MKRVLLAAALVLALVAFSFAQDPHLAQHDFSVTYSNGASAYQGCKGCHVPHGGAIYGDTTQPQRNTVFGPSATTGDFSTGVNHLWDKLISTGSYQTYSSDNLDLPGGLMAAPATATDPAWHSYLCFSCHDGNVAVLNIPSGLVATDNFLMNGGNGDIDLTNDHPVDIAWPTAANGNNVRYALPADVKAGTYATGTVLAMPLFGTDNRIECASCHNPHLQATAASNAFRGNFLRMTTVGDNLNLCRACHLDKR